MVLLTLFHWQQMLVIGLGLSLSLSLDLLLDLRGAERVENVRLDLDLVELASGERALLED